VKSEPAQVVGYAAAPAPGRIQPQQPNHPLTQVEVGEGMGQEGEQYDRFQEG